MEYPTDPTVLPSAQRHTEIYHAEQGRVFTDGDAITIQIPPTNHAYLTKDAQLHFDFDMEYYEGTDANYKEIANALNRDDFPIDVTTGNNTIKIENDGLLTTLTATVSDQYTSIQDICNQMNLVNNTSTYGLSYTDVTNQVTIFAGFRIIKNYNDKLIFRLYPDQPNLEKEITVIIPAGLYAQDGTHQGFIDISDAYNNVATQIKGPILMYNEAEYYKPFFFELVDFADPAPIPYAISKNSSYVLLQQLGFDFVDADYLPGGKAYSVNATPSEKPTLVQVINSTAPPYIVTTLDPSTIWTTQVGELATRLGFTLGQTFNKNPDGTQWCEGTPIANPEVEYSPAIFFKNLIYKGPPTKAIPPDPLSIYQLVYRPYPTLDVNGPYSFFESLEVYDYLGNTLLEKVPRHDLLTAIWADLENSVETQQEIIRARQVSSVNNLTITKPSCSYLVDGDLNEPYRQSPWSNPNDTFFTDTTITAAPITLPRISFGINLYSFLGRLSDKFVPLHNGFTIKFFLNQRTNVIAFNTQQPNNKISYATYNKNEPTSSFHHSTYMKPHITRYNFSNVYLRGDVVTVPPELDSRIDKIVFAKGYKVQAGMADNKYQRINTEVKSLTSVIVVQQQPVVVTNLSTMRNSAFIRNYCYQAKLLFNKAVVSSVNSFQQAYRNFRNVFGCAWDEYVQRDNWNIDEPLTASSIMQTRMIDKNTLSNMPLSLNLDGTPTDPFFLDVSVPLGPLPRYLLTFDTRLPGYTPMAVCGIDTRKQVLELKMDTTRNTNPAAPVTMITEFDTFIEVKPAESTAVSF